MVDWEGEGGCAGPPFPEVGGGLSFCIAFPYFPNVCISLQSNSQLELEMYSGLIQVIGLI